MHRIKIYIISAFVVCLMGFSLLGAATAYQIHTVKKGDTLYDLSKQYGVTVNEIKQLNNLTSSRLSLGQQLKIKPNQAEPKPVLKKDKKPAATPPKPTIEKKKLPPETITQPAVTEETDSNATYQVHTVRRGDSLYKIGKQYGVTVNEIKKLNNLTSISLSVGQKLKVKVAQAEPKPKKKKDKKTDKLPPKPTTDTKKPPLSTLTQPADTVGTGTGIYSSTDGSRKINPADLPEDYFHVVKAKENLYRISLAAGITVKELLAYNGFADEHVLITPGQKLIIKDPVAFQSGNETIAQPDGSESGNSSETYYTAPPDSVLIEKVYVVQRKDTLFKIAKANNMTVEELKKLNHLTSNYLKAGQRLYIIAPRGKAKPEPVAPLFTEEDLKVKTKIRTDLIMPIDGKVISEYGIRNGRPHKGIDLGAPTGVPIYAVLDGTVVYSGLQGNYGNVVVIEHPDYVMTVYAHNEKNLVSVGETVKQGQVIATVGSTGNATCSHCHFEYRIKGKAINPRKALPLGK